MWPFEICMALLLCNRKLIYVGRQSSNSIHFTLHQYHISKFLKPSKPPNSASYWELNRFNLLQANIACLGWKAPLFKGFCTRGVMKNSLICLCLLWLKSYIKYLYISNQRGLILNYVLPYVYFRVCVCVYISYQASVHRILVSRFTAGYCIWTGTLFLDRSTYLRDRKQCETQLICSTRMNYSGKPHLKTNPYEPPQDR